MILLDTNVVSALMQTPPDERVVAWLDTQREMELWIPSITVLEIVFGMERMAPGRRRDQLTAQFEALLDEDMDGRVAVFDEAAARAAASLAAVREARGHSVGTEDTQIAGIAIARRAAICTRNTRDFPDAGVVLHNPWA